MEDSFKRKLYEQHRLYQRFIPAGPRNWRFSGVANLSDRDPPDSGRGALSAPGLHSPDGPCGSYNDPGLHEKARGNHQAFFLGKRSAEKGPHRLSCPAGIPLFSSFHRIRVFHLSVRPFPN